MTKKHGKTPRAAGRARQATQTWVKPLSAAKPASVSARSTTQAKRGAPASLKKELLASAATDQTGKTSAAKKAPPSQREANPTRRSQSSESPAALTPREASAAVAPARPPFDRGLSKVRTLLSSARPSPETWSGPLAASASEASRGLAEINGKWLDLMRVQIDATFNLWRSMLTVRSFGEAVELQARELRKQFETTTAHAKDIAATTRRVAAEAVWPMRAAFSGASRAP